MSLVGGVPVAATPEDIDHVVRSFSNPDEASIQMPSVLVTDSARNATALHPGAGESRRGEASRLAATRLEFDTQVRRFEQAKARLQATIEQTRQGRPQREVLHDSAFARLQARLESMPVIEQAKGILMAQQRCGPDEAFDLLRRASQRANVKVSILAAQIVEQVAVAGAIGSAEWRLVRGLARRPQGIGHACRAPQRCRCGPFGDKSAPAGGQLPLIV
jgi:hypothetical protein